MPEAIYNTITEKSRDNAACREANRAERGLPDTPNGQWYYTYDNVIAGMAELEHFAGEGDENTRKLEVAAFLANVAQAMGVDVPEGWAVDCAGQKNFAECPSYKSPTSRCGAGWADAQAKCGTFCVGDADCPTGETCFGSLKKQPCPD